MFVRGATPVGRSVVDGGVVFVGGSLRLEFVEFFGDAADAFFESREPRDDGVDFFGEVVQASGELLDGAVGEGGGLEAPQVPVRSSGL